MSISLNEKLVIQWLRERAKLLSQTADALEAGVQPPVKQENSTPPLNGMGTISLEKVKEIIAVKSQRVKTLARQFAVKEYEVRKIIDSADSGLELGKRGWIQLKKQ